MLSRETKIMICKKNDQQYDGEFFMGVTSTKIYCIPSCPARFPKRKHIVFFDTASNAEQEGFRGCKRCHSAEFGFHPPWIKEIVEYLNNNLETRIQMSDLEDYVDMSRSAITEGFQQYYYQTPLEYHRKLRLDAAKDRILIGEDYRMVAFDSGYESVSGFRSAFQQQFGTTPGKIKEMRV